MKTFCRAAVLALLGLVVVQPIVTRPVSAQSHPESHPKKKTKQRKPKVRRTKTVLQGRHGKHARKPA